MKNLKEISLQEWIEELGAPKISALMQVEVSGVYHWNNGRVLPRPQQMLVIEKLSKGRVTASGMIRSYFARRENKGKWSAK